MKIMRRGSWLEAEYTNQAVRALTKLRWVMVIKTIIFVVMVRCLDEGK